MSTSKVRIVIVGAAGYSGAELVTWLLGHPHASIVGLFGSGKRVDGEKPSTMGDCGCSTRLVLKRPRWWPIHHCVHLLTRLRRV